MVSLPEENRVPRKEQHTVTSLGPMQTRSQVLLQLVRDADQQANERSKNESGEHHPEPS